MAAPKHKIIQIQGKIQLMIYDRMRKNVIFDWIFGNCKWKGIKVSKCTTRQLLTARTAENHHRLHSSSLSSLQHTTFSWNYILSQIKSKPYFRKPHQSNINTFLMLHNSSCYFNPSVNFKQLFKPQKYQHCLYNHIFFFQSQSRWW